MAAASESESPCIMICMFIAWVFQGCRTLSGFLFVGPCPCAPLCTKQDVMIMLFIVLFQKRTSKCQLLCPCRSFNIHIDDDDHAVYCSFLETSSSVSRKIGLVRARS